MVFTSREYLVFFVACAVLYFALPYRFRWILLLAASYAFYAVGDAQYLPLLIFVSLTAYAAGRLLEAVRNDRHRAILLSVTLVALLAPLFVYKYLSFFLESASGALMLSEGHRASLGFDILLPLGISFFTFQAVGYVIDVHKGGVPAERHVGLLSLYISFFPQLIAGPIERARRLLPQLRRTARLDPEAVTSGGLLILWGTFKKVVIADNLAPYVDTAYAGHTAYAGLPLLIATVFFAFQVYCDFSAYVDIARGSARILGIELMRNFDRPYGARSIGEFWHRWHISLSTWFRDYVYIPLGGNRRGMTIRSRNLAIVFLLSGLWHGANWTFVVWGGLHGLALILSQLTAGMRRRLTGAIGLGRLPMTRDVLSLVATFTFVCFAWIFFRASSLDDAFYISTHLFTGIAGQLETGEAIARVVADSDGSMAEFLALSAAVSALFVWHTLPEGLAEKWRTTRPRWQRWSAYYVMAFGVLFWTSADTDAFIYFRF